jgi:hypothetical protein
MNSNSLSHGTKVSHRKYGTGMVYGEWESIAVDHGEGKRLYGCAGVFDVIFRRSSGEPFIHCCRAQYLKKPEVNIE